RKQCLPKFDRATGNVIESYTFKDLDDQAKDKFNKLFPKGDNFVLQNNRNRLLFTLDGADGMKTGHTDADGYCLVSSVKQDGERFISLVLGTTSSAQRDSETAK
ncbi:D-alanyl-D-alanine carboxypeptidase, partial [Francisella tularensis subsp. holarctica]|nr:D-alanyl-D-alanine carboxypeptidase [Francisella tularensis subsp. holarctica]